MYMEKPPPDPVKLLNAWMEWERGENPPGRVISNLKTAGMRELLEELAAKAAPSGGDADTGGATDPPSTEAWTPVV
jgi:hypothetical protein